MYKEWGSYLPEGPGLSFCELLEDPTTFASGMSISDGFSMMVSDSVIRFGKFRLG